MSSQDSVLVNAHLEWLPLPFQLNQEKPIKLLFDLLRQYDQTPIISVGCENGYLEAYVKKHSPLPPFFEQILKSLKKRPTLNNQKKILLNIFYLFPASVSVSFSGSFLFLIFLLKLCYHLSLFR